MAQDQIFVMTGSLDPDLLFENLISNFDPIQKEFFFPIFLILAQNQKKFSLYDSSD